MSKLEIQNWKSRNPAAWHDIDANPASQQVATNI
jgi:hypothetical protein